MSIFNHFIKLFKPININKLPLNEDFLVKNRPTKYLPFITCFMDIKVIQIQKVKYRKRISSKFPKLESKIITLDDKNFKK